MERFIDEQIIVNSKEKESTAQESFLKMDFLKH